MHTEPHSLSRHAPFIHKTEPRWENDQTGSQRMSNTDVMNHDRKQVKFQKFDPRLFEKSATETTFCVPETPDLLQK